MSDKSVIEEIDTADAEETCGGNDPIDGKGSYETFEDIEEAVHGLFTVFSRRVRILRREDAVGSLPALGMLVVLNHVELFFEIGVGITR